MDITSYLEGRLNPEPPLPSKKEARSIYAQVRASVGLSNAVGSWLTAPTDNLKFKKTQVRPTWGWSGLPNWMTTDWLKTNGMLANNHKDGINFCGNNSPACTACCLNTAGKGPMYSVQMGRLARSIMLMAHPEAFASLIVHELQRLEDKWGSIAFRPNVLTDVVWEEVWPELFERFPNIQFYDYTKHWERDQYPFDNYYLTYSATEHHTLEQIHEMVDDWQHNVAVVVDHPPKEPKPTHWAGLLTIDGDDPIKGDARYLDPEGRVVLLSAKGKARRAAYRTAGFVWPIDQEYT